MMPDVDVVGDVGAKISNKGTFKVADVGHLADFTKVIIDVASPEFHELNPMVFLDIVNRRDFRLDDYR